MKSSSAEKRDFLGLGKKFAVERGQFQSAYHGVPPPLPLRTGSGRGAAADFREPQRRQAAAFERLHGASPRPRRPSEIAPASMKGPARSRRRDGSPSRHLRRSFVFKERHLVRTGRCAAKTIAFIGSLLHHHVSSSSLDTRNTSAGVVTPCAHQPPTVFHERLHALAPGDVLRLQTRPAAQEHLPDGGAHRHQFKERLPSPSSRSCGRICSPPRATPSRPATPPRCALSSRVRSALIPRLAIRAQHAHQPLTHHRFQRRRDEVRLHAHVHQPRQCAGRVVRVQRGKNHVAGERRLHGDLRGFLIADFTDEHHVGIMTQNRAQVPWRTSCPPFRSPESG